MIELRHTWETQPVYDHIYTGTAINQMDSFFLWIQSLLVLRPGTRLLDVSTGRGQMIKLARLRGIDAYGIDFSMKACQLAHAKSPGAIVQCDGQFLPFPDNSFDVVTNLGSLEHFDNMDLGVQEMVRVLRPQGLACLTVPNLFGLLWSVNVGWRTGDIDDDGQPLQRYGTRRQWQVILERNGLRILRVLGYEHEHAFPRSWKDAYYYWPHPLRTAIMCMASWIPVNAAGQFVFVCQKTIP
jgi:SAM-dependent methyltransferase